MSLLAHITDTHLYADPEECLKGIPTRESFIAVTEAAYETFPVYDAVVLGGDLSQDNSEDAYRTIARVMLERDAPVYAVAGNHDDPEKMHEILNPTVRFNNSIAKVKMGKWQLLLLNSRNDGKISGQFSDALLDRLEQMLGDEPELHQLIVMHHHPAPVGSRWMDEIGLRNSEFFWDVVEQHASVRGVLFGHVHQAFDQMRGSIRLLGTPSTMLQFKPGVDDFAMDDISPGFRWLRLLDDGSIETDVVRIEGFIPVDLNDHTGY